MPHFCRFKANVATLKKLRESGEISAWKRPAFRFFFLRTTYSVAAGWPLLRELPLAPAFRFAARMRSPSAQRVRTGGPNDRRRNCAPHLHARALRMSLYFALAQVRIALSQENPAERRHGLRERFRRFHQ